MKKQLRAIGCVIVFALVVTILAKTPSIAAGGSFRGTYAGTYNLKQCSFEKGNGVFNFRAPAQGSFSGKAAKRVS